MMWLKSWCCCAMLVLGMLQTAQAQLLGTWRGEDWVTHQTAHFAIHSPKSLAHRVPEVAAHAQAAHAALRQKLAWQPQHRIHVLLTDDSDDANGWATVMPYGLVLLNVSPPDDVFFLDHYDNWLRTVVWHELTHIFHMDQAAGGQAAVQSIFGRLPLAFAHQYQPLWLLEGLAIDSESIAAARSGRLHTTFHEMRMRAEVAQGLADLNTVSLAARVWPTDQAYLYGTWFYAFLGETLGPQALERWLRTYRASLPGFVNPAAKLAWGENFDQLWPKYQAWLSRKFPPLSEPHPQGQALTRSGLFDARPVRQGQWVYRVRYDADLGHRLERYQADGRTELISELDTAGPMDVNDQGQIAMARPLRSADGRSYHDVWLWTPSTRKWQRITQGQRYRDVRWTSDGKGLVVKRIAAGVSSLHRIQADGQWLAKLWQGHDHDVLGAYSVHPNGQRLVAAIKRGQRSWNLEVLDLPSQSWQVLLQGPSIYADPVYSEDGERVLFSAEDGKAYNVFELDVARRNLQRRSRSNTGAFTPIYGQDGDVFFQRFSARGYDLARLSAQELLTEPIATALRVAPTAAPPVSEAPAAAPPEPTPAALPLAQAQEPVPEAAPEVAQVPEKKEAEQAPPGVAAEPQPAVSPIVTVQEPVPVAPPPVADVSADKEAAQTPPGVAAEPQPAVSPIVTVQEPVPVAPPPVADVPADKEAAQTPPAPEGPQAAPAGAEPLPFVGLIHLAPENPRISQAPVVNLELDPPQAYSPWDTLKPRFWAPVLSSTPERRQLGLVTGGRDASLRHTYDLTLVHDNVSDKLSGLLNYRFDTRYQALMERTLTEVRHNGTLQTLDQTDRLGLIRLSAVRADLDRLRLHVGAVYQKADNAWTRSGVAVSGAAQERIDAGVLLQWNHLRQNLNHVGGAGSGWHAALTVEGQNRARDAQDWHTRLAVDARYLVPLGDAHVAGLRGYAANAQGGASGYKLGSFDATQPTTVTLGRDSYPLRGYAQSALLTQQFQAVTLDYRMPIARVNRAWGVHPFGLDNVYATAFVDHARLNSKQGYTGYGVELTAEPRFLYFLKLPVTVGVAKGSDPQKGERQVWLRVRMDL
jgi:hypothetical protein